jgi:hypothetical protein
MQLWGRSSFRPARAGLRPALCPQRRRRRTSRIQTPFIMIVDINSLSHVTTLESNSIQFTSGKTCHDDRCNLPVTLKVTIDHNRYKRRLFLLPGSTSGGIFHDHDFRHISKLAEIFSQAFGTCLPTETSDKHFPGKKNSRKKNN